MTRIPKGLKKKIEDNIKEKKRREARLLDEIVDQKLSFAIFLEQFETLIFANLRDEELLEKSYLLFDDLLLKFEWDDCEGLENLEYINDEQRFQIYIWFLEEYENLTNLENFIVSDYSDEYKILRIIFINFLIKSLIRLNDENEYLNEK